MSRTPQENPVAGWGCILCLTAIVITAIVTGKVDVSAWFKPAPAPAQIGRYQIVSGRTHTNIYSSVEVATMIKIDTVTGKTWILFPLDVGENAVTKQMDVLGNRWVEAKDVFPPKRESNKSP